jgi:antitoxin CptB|tara:strand:- start:39 stop:293 length:255 start_codon:yes stop_codon:yes gene_type:complete
MNELEIFKKKLIYRSNYRGTKEMDILLGGFVKKYIDIFDKIQLIELEKFLDFDDEIILNYYQHNIVKKNIDKNKVSQTFKLYDV